MSNFKEEIVLLLKLNIDDEKVIDELTTLLDKVREEARADGIRDYLDALKIYLNEEDFTALYGLYSLLIKKEGIHSPKPLRHDENVLKLFCVYLEEHRISFNYQKCIKGFLQSIKEEK